AIDERDVERLRGLEPEESERLRVALVDGVGQGSKVGGGHAKWPGEEQDVHVVVAGFAPRRLRPLDAVGDAWRSDRRVARDRAGGDSAGGGSVLWEHPQVAGIDSRDRPGPREQLAHSRPQDDSDVVGLRGPRCDSGAASSEIAWSVSSASHVTQA